MRAGTKIFATFGVVLALAGLTACADDDVLGRSTTPAAQLLDATTASSGDAGQASDAGVGCPVGQVLCGRCMEAFAPTAEVIQQRIFTRSCALSSACHTGNAAQAGLALSSIDEAQRTAVAQPSRQQPGRLVLAPGNPGQSYLVDKLRGHQAAATTRMPPPPSEPLCEAKIQAIEAWIAAGATR